MALVCAERLLDPALVVGTGVRALVHLLAVIVIHVTQRRQLDIRRVYRLGQETLANYLSCLKIFD